MTKKTVLTGMVMVFCFMACPTDKTHEVSIKDFFDGKFYMGTALNSRHILGKDTLGVEIVKKHFNSIVAENCMKSGLIQSQKGVFDFALADRFVEFGEENNMFIVGHTLIWHRQTPKWFFVDDNGNTVSREVMTDRMRNHIYTVVGRYKGRVHGWDVVNEAILDDGSMRKNRFYEIIGEDYVRLAFQFAHEADPDAELYYNDYAMALPGKRKGVVEMVKSIQNEELKIHGIGMQAHSSLDFPSIVEFEKSLLAYSDLGVKVMITELDISALPVPKNEFGADIDTLVAYKEELNPYTEGLSIKAEQSLKERYREFFELFVKHRDKIDRVTFWGVQDGQSWRNNFPVAGRTDYPLLFDRNYELKSFALNMLQELEGNPVWPRYLVGHMYIADPSAHVFEGKLYIYPSHDIESGIAENDNGDHFAMSDYHVFSMETVNGEVTDHGRVLDKDDIPWAGRQLWAPDAAHKNGKYYLYFPLKDKNDIFRIGVAVGEKPEGPFTPEKNPIKGSYSMDPAVYMDSDGTYYMYFGGIWGGQLQRYRANKALECGHEPADDEPALCAKIAKLTDDMLQFAEEPKDVVILDKEGEEILAGDHDRRFFEAAWMHKYNGKYYFSYSTGNTHKLCYAVGYNPYGPFTYQGVLLTPVVGWTTHHSIVEFKRKWYLFYHDSKPSGGVTWLRSVKFRELEYNDDGTIKIMDGGV